MEDITYVSLRISENYTLKGYSYACLLELISKRPIRDIARNNGNVRAQFLNFICYSFDV